MAAPNLFSLFEGYRAQADLERADQQRAEQARASQLNFDVASRQEAEAQDGMQARSNQRQIDLNLTRFALEDQPTALEDKGRTLAFDRAGREEKIKTETPMLGQMATIVAERQMETAVLGLKQIQFSNRQEDVRQRISSAIQDQSLDALQRQQVASQATTALASDEEYQGIMASAQRVSNLSSALATGAQANDMVLMNRVGQQLGVVFKTLDGVDGAPRTIQFRPADSDTWSPWLGQESIPGWAAMQGRTAAMEQRELAKAQAALVYNDKLVEAQERHRIEQQKLTLQRAELEIKAGKAGGTAGATPSLVTGVAAPTSPAASAPPAPTIGAAPTTAQSVAARPVPTRLQRPAADPAAVPAPGARAPSLLEQKAAAENAALRGSTK